MSEVRWTPRSARSRCSWRSDSWSETVGCHRCAHQQRSHDRPHAVHQGDGGAAGRDRHLDPRFGLGELGVEAADVAEQLFGQCLAVDLNPACRTDGAQQIERPERPTDRVQARREPARTALRAAGTPPASAAR